MSKLNATLAERARLQLQSNAAVKASMVTDSSEVFRLAALESLKAGARGFATDAGSAAGKIAAERMTVEAMTQNTEAISDLTRALEDGLILKDGYTSKYGG